MTFEEAFKLAKSKREKINPNVGFVKQLKEYNDMFRNGENEK